MKRDWSFVLGEVLVLVDRASDIVKAAYARADVRVDYKAPGDPVTDADRAANALLCEGLITKFPEAAVVGEETVDAARGDRTKAELSFFVDPLDGTRDFVDRTGEFAVMVGAVHEGRAALGVIKEPISGRTFASAPGLGAFEIVDGERRAIHVSGRDVAAGAKVLVSRTRVIADVEALTARLSLVPTRTGSAGVKGARVACGEADAFVHLGTAGSLWDAAAVDAIVTQAGGRFTDQFGQHIDYAQPSFENARGVITANAALHAALLEAAAAIREGRA